jgi:hypothetical protein
MRNSEALKIALQYWGNPGAKGPREREALDAIREMIFCEEESEEEESEEEEIAVTSPTVDQLLTAIRELPETERINIFKQLEEYYASKRR